MHNLCVLIRMSYKKMCGRVGFSAIPMVFLASVIVLVLVVVVTVLLSVAYRLHVMPFFTRSPFHLASL